MFKKRHKNSKMRVGEGTRAVKTLHSYTLPAILMFVLVLFITLTISQNQVFAEEGESADLEATTSYNTMYRLYNKYTGEHFYTSDSKEKSNLVKVGWNDEGTGWYAPISSKTPVYRLYNKYVSGGDHHYTTSTSERDTLRKAGWSDEGTGWYSDDAKGTPLYRQYNPYAQTGTHNYTTSTAERDNVVKAGWKNEGVGWYGVKVSTVDAYWLASANSDTPESNILKTATEIQQDMAILHSGSSNQNYAKVKAEYESYTNNDNVHLYTKWNGSTKDASSVNQPKNGYVEFRVIQVGEHDGDGSSVTFMASHALPDGYKISNSAGSYVGSWQNSTLRQKLQAGSNGTIYNNLNTAFTSQILSVDKKTHDGYGKTSVSTSKESLWIPSYGEITGTTSSATWCPKYSTEGSQYSWFSKKGVKPKTDNECLVLSTRAGNHCTEGLSSLSGGSTDRTDRGKGYYWYLRTPVINDEYAGLSVSGSGYPDCNGNNARCDMGVVLCFCF